MECQLPESCAVESVELQWELLEFYGYCKPKYIEKIHQAIPSQPAIGNKKYCCKLVKDSIATTYWATSLCYIIAQIVVLDLTSEVHEWV